MSLTCGGNTQTYTVAQQVAAGEANTLAVSTAPQVNQSAELVANSLIVLKAVGCVLQGQDGWLWGACCVSAAAIGTVLSVMWHRAMGVQAMHDGIVGKGWQQDTGTPAAWKCRTCALPAFLE
jgi:hypothetical protein